MSNSKEKKNSDLSDIWMLNGDWFLSCYFPFKFGNENFQMGIARIAMSITGVKRSVWLWVRKFGHAKVSNYTLTTTVMGRDW